MFIYSFVEQVMAQASASIVSGTGLLAALGGLGAFLAIVHLRSGAFTRPCAMFWALQIPAVSLPNFSYGYYVGASLTLGFGVEPLRVFGTPHYGIGFTLGLEQTAPTAHLALNLVAISAVVVFSSSSRRGVRA